jgi:DNA-directed RNA polymerase subunit RPC12/RpoP
MPVGGIPEAADIRALLCVAEASGLDEGEGVRMNRPDFWKILLSAIFPNGIPPHQYSNLAVLSIDIAELEELYDQIERTEKDNGGNIIIRDGAERQNATLRNVAEVRKEVTKSTSEEATKSPQNNPEVSSKPFISGTYPANFEDAPIEPMKKRMGRPPREPGSLGLKCPKCGSDNVVAGGFGPNKERRIRCKDCNSQPTINASNSEDIDERILALEFEDLSPVEISERLSIPVQDIESRLKELHATPEVTA